MDPALRRSSKSCRDGWRNSFRNPKGGGVDPIHSLIVGGTRGTGSILATVLADEGHSVSVLGRNAPARTPEVHRDIRHWPVDLLDKRKLRRVLDAAIRETGRLKNLIFLQRYKGNGDAWSGELETSLTATRFVIEHCSKSSVRNGSIVVVSSQANRFVAT